MNNILFLSGATLEALSSGVWMMSAGRLLIGLGCGGVSVVVPLYLGEIAPPNLRGALGTPLFFPHFLPSLALKRLQEATPKQTLNFGCVV